MRDFCSENSALTKNYDDAEAIYTLHCREKYSVFSTVGTRGVGRSVVDPDPNVYASN